MICDTKYCRLTDKLFLFKIERGKSSENLHVDWKENPLSISNQNNNPITLILIKLLFFFLEVEPSHRF